VNNPRFDFEFFDSSDSSLPDDVMGAGSFLVATSKLKESPFERTVIYMLQHGDQGSFGVVVNRPADAEARSAWQQISGFDHGERFTVQGGPISGPVFALHQNASLAEMEMPGGLCVSADSQTLKKLAHSEDEYRIVFGVSGWRPGQLSDEIESGAWYQLDTESDHVFDDSSRMWENFLRHYGRGVLSDVINVTRFPENPWLN
jgi:putative transcriptional regulator